MIFKKQVIKLRCVCIIITLSFILLLTGLGFCQSGDICRFIQVEKSSANRPSFLPTGTISPSETSLIPRQCDESKATRGKIQKIAKKNGLFERKKINPDLKYTEGDISFWTEQDLLVCDIELKFLAMRLVLEAAEQSKIVIESKGDLTHWADKATIILRKIAVNEVW